MLQEQTIDLNSERLSLVGKALSSDIRIRILRLLGKEPLNVNEIADRLGIPASSSAMHVKVLEESGLISTSLKPATRGSMKICSRQLDLLHISLDPPAEETQKSEVISMPIGSFVDYQVTPTCGIVSNAGHIDEEDEPRVFYNPKRSEAKLLWFGSGYVEYRFPNASLQNVHLKSMEVSAELCSETVDYNLDCPSDITLWVNGLDAGTWTCPSDFGGRRGKLNPDWWPNKNSQYGKLKTWRFTKNGTYLNGVKVSPCPLEDYALADHPYISVRIGIKEDAKHIGGVNIFGDSFGDYPQNIELKLFY
ncbi:ArsR/SmtB family transcription factor [Diplocloster agilis]|uniref:Helix-turn-helix domain-containing protein n=1 Tax=Diplocloster agilis TaxID=2850323 RepID=A0A949JZW6_9FIRM|nr:MULTISPECIES: helix-turn-helix domain-containing protein [Lachnospiraceae]MBU9737639.1 helix-turn-helix domain-containing protein [Diplocloster agilis]MCU6736745.1 helix-turn-helix domain-containing protein [Suonthocola fibrivorans]SCJ93328.1 Helix-turn-helix domain [uncultured Clostridium sp.]